MKFIEIAKIRHSVRNYTSKKIEESKLNLILEAAHVAPTAANLQPVQLMVIKGECGLKKLSKAANLHGATLAIVVCVDHQKEWIRPYDEKRFGEVDASILTDHMMLQATELGLGSVWIDFFQPDIISKEFNIPENLEPVHILAIGYSNCESASVSRFDYERKPMDELVIYESF